jgi:hypothetical protein
MCFLVRDSPESFAPEPHFQVGSLVLEKVKVEASQSGREAWTLLKSGWGFRFTAPSASAREVWSWPWDLGSGMVGVVEWRGRRGWEGGLRVNDGLFRVGKRPIGERGERLGGRRVIDLLRSMGRQLGVILILLSCSSDSSATGRVLPEKLPYVMTIPEIPRLNLIMQISGDPFTAPRGLKNFVFV